jgi:hypothetical protein
MAESRRANLPFRHSWGLLTVFAVASAVACGPVIKAYSQSPVAKSQTAQNQKGNLSGTSPKVFEDDEVKAPIPAGWEVLKRAHAVVLPSTRELLLEKDGSTLDLLFDTQQTSGIAGGRFIEIFTIPWLGPNQAWDCSLHFIRVPEPVSHALMFIKLTLATGDSRVREICGIGKDLSYRTQGGKGRIIGYRRWFGGFFSNGLAGWFFDSKGAGCGEKAYTLTSSAKTPEKLPIIGDPNLKRITNEAIDIVHSIQYKRCPPAPAWPFDLWQFGSN